MHTQGRPGPGVPHSSVHLVTLITLQGRKERLGERRHLSRSLGGRSGIKPRYC